MKNHIIAATLALVAFACGAPAEEFDEELGSMSSAIYIPYQYGGEGAGAHEACDDNWEGGECWAPNSKTFYVGFAAATCNSWWQARFVEAWNEEIADDTYVNSLADASAQKWSINAVPMIMGQPAIAPGLIYNWKCQATDGNASFQPNTSNSDDSSGTYGTIRQHKGGTLRVDVADIQASVQWVNADDSRRQRAARNIIRHEIKHMRGHGHAKAGGSDNPGLMGGYDFWNSEYWLNYSQYRRQACYNAANGGLFDECP